MVAVLDSICLFIFLFFMLLRRLVFGALLRRCWSLGRAAPCWCCRSGIRLRSIFLVFGALLRRCWSLVRATPFGAAAGTCYLGQTHGLPKIVIFFTPNKNATSRWFFLSERYSHSSKNLFLHHPLHQKGLIFFFPFESKF